MLGNGAEIAITYTLKGSTSTTLSLENILKPPTPFLFVFETRLFYSGWLQIHYGVQASLKKSASEFQV